MTKEEILSRVATVPHWYHQIDLGHGIVTPGINDSAENLRLLDLPQDCTGLTALDIGARDGFFSFELERRGAQVVAVDYMPAASTGFAVAAEVLNSRVSYLQENVYNLSERDLGEFDIVLFLGLLYHLPDPLGALRIARDLCRGSFYLETLIIDGLIYLDDGAPLSLKQIDPRLEKLPLMQFFPGASRNNDKSNFWGPNSRCVEAMLEESEFEVNTAIVGVDRAVFRCSVASDADKRYQLAIAQGKLPITVP